MITSMVFSGVGWGGEEGIKFFLKVAGTPNVSFFLSWSSSSKNRGREARGKVGL